MRWGRGRWKGVLSEYSGRPGFREHSNEVTTVAGEQELDICCWGKGEGASCISVCRKSSSRTLYPPVTPYPCPHPHTFQRLPGLARRTARVRASSVVLSETARIVSKLTHTTNVREPCHTALGSASCCLRGRRCGRGSPAGASGSALGAGAGAGRGRGGVRPFGAAAPPLLSLPRGPQ